MTLQQHLAYSCGSPIIPINLERGMRTEQIRKRSAAMTLCLRINSRIKKAPELANACRETLNRRGDGGTGWSRAWKVNFWARLGDGDRAWTLFKSLLYPAVDLHRWELI